MKTHDPNDVLSPADRAIANRLSKLGTMPVDTARLEASLRSVLPPPPGPTEERTGRMRIGWFQPFRAVAASFVLLSAVVAIVLLSSSSGPALASASQMARMHDDLVSGRTPVMQVGSIDEANRALASQWPGGPTVPGVPQSHVMACCMRSIKDKRIACVLLKSEGEPVTMTVASAADMRLPKSPTTTRGGVAYHVQSSGGLQMVISERNGRWVCLIAKFPVERLMDLASELAF